MGDNEEDLTSQTNDSPRQLEDEDSSAIPKSSIAQIVKSVLAETAQDSSIEVNRLSQEARDSLSTCGALFIRQVTDEAYAEFSGSSRRKTMSHDYLIKTMNQHGLSWISDKCLSVAEESKVMNTAAKKRKSSKKLEALGIPFEELLRQQEALIDQVGSAFSRRITSPNYSFNHKMQ